jgi:tetraacyldisaccharide 4'-kinase
MRTLISEAERLKSVLATTPKDAVRIPAPFRDRVTVVGVSLAWESEAALNALLDPLFLRETVSAA